MNAAVSLAGGVVLFALAAAVSMAQGLGFFVMSFTMQVGIFLGNTAAELAVEGEHHHPHGVESGENYPQEQPYEGNDVDPVRKMAVPVKGGQQDFILAPEPGQGDDADEAEGGYNHQQVGGGHIAPQPPHVPHIERAAGMIHASRAQEQQGLEYRVRD